ncbi:clan AA aspartic protease [Archaeoglobales archaeon]|mgnify:CR=1 FL=1|nr:MAG: clan AA aspartic protease [Archaeoglobales archaeon]
MISPLVGAPFLEISIENPFNSRIYPEDGEVLAVVDTGYEGFLMLPENLFKLLGFDELSLEERKLLLPDGNFIVSHGTYGIIKVGDFKCEGFIETTKVDELILGIDFLSNFRITLDYCIKRLEIYKC